MDEKGWPAFKVMVGRVVLQVACERADLIDHFLERYAGFLTDHEAQMDIVVKPIRYGTPSGLLDIKPIFSDRVVKIDAPGYQGMVDLEQGISEIRLPAQRLAEDAEYFIRMVAAVVVYHTGGLMVHAAGIANGDQLYMFFGHSGSGKTTVSRNSPGKLVLNDDLLVLQREGNNWRVYSTPFWNPTQVKPLNLSGKLHALYKLVQDGQVSLEPVSPGMALAEFLTNIPVMNGDPGRSQELIERCLAVINSVPVYHLHFLPDESFWSVLN